MENTLRDFFRIRKIVFGKLFSMQNTQKFFGPTKIKE